MKQTLITSIVIFIILSIAYLSISGAPLRVHASLICSFFLAYVGGTFAAEKQWFTRSKHSTWLWCGLAGLFMFDVLSAWTIGKRELFMGWYFIYPMGLLGLITLQIFGEFIGKKLSNR
ncbi:hypothetical protein RI844_15390 [Thalassotalea fonticola]|uniref:DUF2809 domain-containing protein n=1 Tax=Thalassotalea fonticola TaxID=3065649 RepID=A0ABZ0GMV8_9GAMM|nr:hypothetical protein RI844_15390 [Colwelliaceae bacterium S1-1]